VGDVKSIVSEANRPLICVPNDAEAVAIMLEELAEKPDLRAEIGKANREKAVKHFDAKTMIQSYSDLYSSALGGKWSGVK